MRYVAIIILSLLFLNGCTAFKGAIAMTKSTDDFLTLKQDARIMMWLHLFILRIFSDSEIKYQYG